MAELLALGYGRDRVELFLEGREVPDEILGRHEGSKEVYSKKVLYEL